MNLWPDPILASFSDIFLCLVILRRLISASLLAEISRGGSAFAFVFAF